MLAILRRVSRLTAFMILAALAASSPAFADSDEKADSARTIEPYDRVLLEFRSPPPPGGLDAFLGELAALATERKAELFEPFIVPGFFWERDYGGGFDSEASVLANFKSALSLDDAQTPSPFVADRWNDFDQLLQETSFMVHPERDEVYCSRADPVFADPSIASAVAKASDTQYEIEWVYIQGRQEVRGSPDEATPVIAHLENEAVRVAGWTFLEGENEAFWYEVSLPNAERGHLMPSQVEHWLEQRICFAEDGAGKWRIAGYQGAGD